ncbi:DUF4062 domain-containing protein [Leptospira haakeii]|uniref:DUF4062 domain-containing protein n=1 Tax=Leptospira haakeii TaxID=2023198 RepID=A0ABX4PM68_9LEPT|nr:DUF4062 domain-containing protein [Leptospira haakeii]PKA16411.1 hypothetical protein CH363_09860 [Leptospira haakeii]PKA18094.1 hypothetical protein CH377_19375 [Leptospira haakeii]
MDKRYQVFVSSTFADLKEERSRVIQTLMEMDCIPAGMELFPATDEEQWEFIKKVINDCDYYLLIIAGKYGTVGPDGISYTEKEYDYACEIGLKVIALIHESPDDLGSDKIETDPILKQSLIDFRNKVANGRLVKIWSKPEDVHAKVALSLNRTIRTFPAKGWVRADEVRNEELLSEINELRKENQDLKQKLAVLEDKKSTVDLKLADLDEYIEIQGRYFSTATRPNSYLDWKVKVTWGELFGLISPRILNFPNELIVKSTLASELSNKAVGTSGSMSEHDFQTIKVQFMAYGFINVEYLQTVNGGWAWFWKLNKKGHEQMLKLRTVPTNK